MYGLKKTCFGTNLRDQLLGNTLCYLNVNISYLYIVNDRLVQRNCHPNPWIMARVSLLYKELFAIISSCDDKWSPFLPHQRWYRGSKTGLWDHHTIFVFISLPGRRSVHLLAQAQFGSAISQTEKFRLYSTNFLLFSCLFISAPFLRHFLSSTSAGGCCDMISLQAIMESHRGDSFSSTILSGQYLRILPSKILHQSGSSPRAEQCFLFIATMNRFTGSWHEQSKQ
jgi:hypothetical protein